jgi:catechol 2,3-dioxygenase-like lactoylglutathione lyase family enzyme
VKNLVPILALAALWPMAALRSQVLAPNQAGVSMGHYHTLVRDVAAAKKFWITLGGTPLQVDGTEVVKFPAVLVFLTQGAPSGGNEGSVLDHVGLYVPSVLDSTTKWKAEGLRTDFSSGAKTISKEDVGAVYSPDNLKVELHGDSFIPDELKLALHWDKSLSIPVAGAHLHFRVTESSQKEIQDWYIKMFGGDTGTPAILSIRVGGIRGVSVSIGKSPTATFPTKGRALDHVGFEVKNLEAFCKRLESTGVKFDEPYSKSRHKSFASAALTDPWGTSIELTEGLNRF